MSFSLYDATIPGYLQILGSMLGLIDKAQAYCDEKGMDPETLLKKRLADDMFGLSYQFKSTVVHSIGSINGVRNGEFSPDVNKPPTDFGALTAQVKGAMEALEALTAADVNGFIGKPMQFKTSHYVLDFTAENFLLSFSVPNFYFHAVTAYDILRWQGLAIGKTDFVGAVRKA